MLQMELTKRVSVHAYLNRGSNRHDRQDASKTFGKADRISVLCGEIFKRPSEECRIETRRPIDFGSD